METCGRLVQAGHFVPEAPVGVIARSYTELLDNKAPLVGQLQPLEKKLPAISISNVAYVLIFLEKQNLLIAEYGQ